MFPAPSLNLCSKQGHVFQAENESLVILRPEERFVGIPFFFFFSFFILIIGRQQCKVSEVNLRFCALKTARKKKKKYFDYGVGVGRNQVSGMLWSIKLLHL